MEVNMATNLYELMFLLDSSKMGGDTPGAIAKIHANLEKFHAEIVASRPWDERKPAYPIKTLKKNMKGLYYLIYVRCDPKHINEIEKEYKLNETIVRMLVLYIEPKLEEEMLAVAKDERALALQTAHDEAIDGVEGYEGMGSRKE
jgi:small subunit ribosomal protein S6